MTNIKPQSSWTIFKTLLLALPFLALLGFSVPNAEARDHRHDRRGGYHRQHGRYHDYGRRNYRHRHYYYRGGRRYYGYGNDPYYYGPRRSGVSVRVGL